MRLVLNGITYHDCPVELRERVAFTAEQRHEMLRGMHAEPNISEAVILETCNRLEIYLYARKSFDCGRFLKGLIRQMRPEGIQVWSKHRCEMFETEVVGHLFEVAAGLDSQMLGENQILSQVKSAYTESCNARMSKVIFHKLFHRAFRVGKAVRAQTNINCGAVSIGLAAVELAKRELNLAGSTAIVVGAGENAELVARYLLKEGIGRLYIANRSRDKAAAIAQRSEGCEVIGLRQLSKKLGAADLVVSSTSSAEPIVRREAVEAILSNRRRRLLMIDLAVPRDIEPSVGEFACVRLVNIDELDERVNVNRKKRMREVPKAKEIVVESVREFVRWYRSLDLVPIISKLTGRGTELARAEAKRYATDFGLQNTEKLRAFAESLVRKVLHGPISFVKSGGNGELSSEQIEAVELIDKMFSLQGQGEQ
jgi:glutamyl-tRNA reductase